MRGYKIFNELTHNDDTAARIQRGRKSELIDKRNQCLIARYYYHGCMKKKCYEDTVNALVAEFFITPERIVNIIQENGPLLKAMKEDTPTAYSLQTYWPAWRW